MEKHPSLPASASNLGSVPSSGRLIVLSGPSGSGKSTLARRLLDHPELNLALSISATTRPPRGYERNGVEYHFVSHSEFIELIGAGELLEWATVHENLYGTPRRAVAEALGAGRNILLEIDVQGGRSVRAAFPSAVLIFLAAPSMDELERRLRFRSSESEEGIERRLEGARAELELAKMYDHIIVNDDLERASTELLNVVRNVLCKGEPAHA
jgi:guanylate kinase